MTTSADLCDTPLNSIQQTAVKKSNTPLSKEQKLFNRLTQNITKQRELLLEWQNTLPLFGKKRQETLLPLMENYNQQRVLLIKLFDRAYGQKNFTKTDKSKLAGLIEEISAELLTQMDDPEIKAIHDRYSEVDFDELAAEEQQIMKSMMEKMLDMNLDDDINFRSPDEMMRKIHEQLQKKIEEDAHQQASNPPPQRKKSAKTLAKEAREKQEAENVSQSLREVYRKLASALHPDKEQDRQERKRKTLLMQRVNVAYDAKDLLTLLSLQLEAEQITPDNISTLSESRLKHFNQLLKEQLVDLETEIEAMTIGFIMRFQLDPHQSYTPKSALAKIDYEISEVKAKLRSIQQDIAEFQQIKNLKAWLKNYRASRHSELDEFDDLDELMQGLFAQMRA